MWTTLALSSALVRTSTSVVKTELFPRYEKGAIFLGGAFFQLIRSEDLGIVTVGSSMYSEIDDDRQMVAGVFGEFEIAALSGVEAQTITAEVDSIERSGGRE